MDLATKLESLKRQPKSHNEESKKDERISPTKRRGEWRKTEAGTLFISEDELNTPPFIIVDGRIIESPKGLKEIRIKRCKKFTLPIMTFLPIVNSDIVNSKNEILNRQMNSGSGL